MPISGSIPALITPFQIDDQTIDWKALETLIHWHIENGSDALVIAGTTGESATLSISEHKQLIASSVAMAAGAMDIIAGTGANATQEAIELTKAAKQAGAMSCLSVAPYYNKPTQKGLFLHYQAIAEAVDLPIILYNVPGRTVSDILPETVAELSRMDTIVGIKDTVGLQRLEELKALVDEDFILLTGEDPQACQFLLNGGHGGISVTANVAAKLNAQMYQAALSGQHDQAQQLDAKLQPLHRALFVQSSPIPVKYACSKLGLCSNTLRLPLTPLEEQFEHQVDEAIKSAGLMG